MKRGIILFSVLCLLMNSAFAGETEVFQETTVKVFVRKHPQTGKSFVSLRDEKVPTREDLFKGFVKREIRPDYRLLDPKRKAKEIPYDGPSSDRTKVYVFAATIATLGVAGGAVAAAAIPATAATTGASGGAALYGVGSAAVTLGTVGTVQVKTRLKPGEENYTHKAESHSLEGDPRKISFQEALAAAENDRKI